MIRNDSDKNMNNEDNDDNHKTTRQIWPSMLPRAMIIHIFYERIVNDQWTDIQTLLQRCKDAPKKKKQHPPTATITTGKTKKKQKQQQL